MNVEGRVNSSQGNQLYSWLFYESPFRSMSFGFNLSSIADTFKSYLNFAMFCRFL